MIFPIGDDQVHGGDRPIFSYTLIAANIVVFVAMLMMIPPEEINGFYMTYGSIPGEIVRGQDWWTLGSSMFLHGGMMHLIGNMLFLWVFADNIEATIGPWRFLVFYLLGGLIAGVAHTLFNPESIVPAVGASGAISAVLGAYLVMFPGSRIKVLILIFFTSASVPAFLFLGFWIVQQMISGVGSISTVDLDTGGVAWWAHIGGFVFGFLAGFYFRTLLKRRASEVDLLV